MSSVDVVDLVDREIDTVWSNWAGRKKSVSRQRFRCIAESSGFFLFCLFVCLYGLNQSIGNKRVNGAGNE